MTNETKGENIVYLDIETQYLMKDFPGGWGNERTTRISKLPYWELYVMVNIEHLESVI